MKLARLNVLLLALVSMFCGKQVLADNFNVLLPKKDTAVRSKIFLKPIRSSPQERASMFSFCNNLPNGMKCPPIESLSETGNDKKSSFEFGISANLPNVLVTFYIQEISNKIVANGGVEPNGHNAWVSWKTVGSQLDKQNGDYAFELPAPGETRDDFPLYGGPLGLRIYDALVFDKCGSLSSFDVSHDANIFEEFIDLTNENFIGHFHGYDTTTIDSTGYYRLNYTIRATDSEGGVSDFHFKGMVNVICTGINQLP